MTDTPKVSIIMGTFNRAHMLDKAIEALRRQTLTDWELIIADDASIDRTPEVVAEWASREPRLVSLRHEVNQGISRNYNAALQRSRGEFIAMLDDDDVWCVPEKLERQVEFLEDNPEYVGCGGGLIAITPGGEELYRFLKPETDGEIRREMLFSNPMANSTTLFRRGAAERVGWYDSSLRYSGDRDFWMKMGLIGKLHNFPEYLGFYTTGNHNTSIVHMKPHLKTSLMLTSRYRQDYPNYPLALMLNTAQYWYAFLPQPVRRHTQRSVMRLKRLITFSGRLRRAAAQPAIPAGGR